ncbi:MAG: WD40 repeat domain-containing protein [Alphaproteobacteria bacterium]|nr:WD40 repeat domain-containing protein [Alphaproteobacteria bacterium]
MTEPNHWAFNHFVTAIAITPSGSHVGFALGNGTLRLVTMAERIYHKSQEIKFPSNGSGDVAVIQCLTAINLGDDIGDVFITGDDAGCVNLVTLAGKTLPLVHHNGRWIEKILVTENNDIFYSFGKILARLPARQIISHFRAVSSEEKSAPPTNLKPILYPAHEATISDLHQVGTNIAVAYFGGISLWPLAASRGTDTDEITPPAPESAKILPWKGALLCLAASPDGDYLAAGLGEGELHVWRLKDGTDLRMSGYGAKIKAIAWTPDSRYLLGSGVPEMMGWDFTGPGPEGSEPRPFYIPPEKPAQRGEARSMPPNLTCLAASPVTAANWHLAGGYEEGGLILVDLGLNGKKNGMLRRIEVSRRAAISCLVCSGDGKIIAAGAEDGKAVIVGED